MRRDAQQYIKLEDHERILSDQYTENRKEVERQRERVKEAEKRADALGYQRGMADAWKDALGLLRRLSLKDATSKAAELVGKGKK